MRQAVTPRDLGDGTFGGLPVRLALLQVPADLLEVGRSGAGGPLDDERELTAGPIGEVLQRLADGAAEHLLERLSQLAADGDAAVAPFGVHVGEAAQKPVRRLEGDYGVRVVAQGGEQATALAGAAGEKAQVGELPGGQAGDRERGRNGGGAGDRRDGESRLQGRRHQIVAGVADDGRAAFGNEGDVAVAQGGEDLGGPRRPVVLVIADEAGLPAGRQGADAVAGEQLAGGAGVLGGDEGDLTQDAKGTKGDVLQVADRGGDDV